MTNNIMAEIQHKYDLRPRVGNPRLGESVPLKRAAPTKRAPKITAVPQMVVPPILLKPQITSQAYRMQPEVKDMEKIVPPFDLEHKLYKIKIQVPLLELSQNPVYKTQLHKFLKALSTSVEQDMVNLEDEYPTIMVGNHVEERDDSVPPFYVTLTIHDKLMHNCMLDSGPSHNLMPKTVMEELVLEITRAYHDLYLFDSRFFQCIGVMNDLVVTLTQIPMKSVVMDSVVADIPAKYKILLS